MTRSSVVYILGHMYTNRFYTKMGRFPITETVPFEWNPDQCMVGRLSNSNIEIFFPSPIFNSYVLSVDDEDEKIRMFSYDSKEVILVMAEGEKDVELNRVYLVKTLDETEDARRVMILKNNFVNRNVVPEPDMENSLVFPGRVFRGKISTENKDRIPMISTIIGTGEVFLQNNEVYEEVEVVLSQCDGIAIKFSEINRPVVECTVEAEESENRPRAVSYGNIHGFLQTFDTQNRIAFNVIVGKVLVGMYIFEEKLEEGKEYTVRLVNKVGGYWVVECGGRKGISVINNVNKYMTGVIYNVHEKIFKFERTDI